MHAHSHSGLVRLTAASGAGGGGSGLGNGGSRVGESWAQEADEDRSESVLYQAASEVQAEAAAAACMAGEPPGVLTAFAALSPTEAGVFCFFFCSMQLFKLFTH